MNPQETKSAGKFPVAKVLGIILLLATAGAMAPMAVRLVEFRAGHSITDDAFIEARMVHVGPDGVSGRITRVETDEGTVAKKGQVLFEIDEDHYRDQLALAEAKARVTEDERRRQEIALEKLRLDVPLGVSEANRSLEMARISEARMEKVLKLTADEVAGTLSESDALVGVAVANQVLARQEHERFTTLLKENATTLRRTQETARTNDSTKAELRLAEAKRQKAAAARSQVEVAAHDLEIARVATAKARLGVDIAENRNRGILEAQQALRIAGDAVDEAKALLNLARRNLENTKVLAPVSGIVVRRAKSTGDHATAGVPVITMYDPDWMYVTANLEETRLAGMAPGNPATVRVDALGRELPARVLWINRSTGAEFSLLPRNVVSGEFSKVVQRVPVRLVFEPGQDLSELRAGYSVRVTIRHGPGDAAWASKALEQARRLDSRFDEPRGNAAP